MAVPVSTKPTGLVAAFVAAGLMLALYLLVTAVGAAEFARGETVLGFFSPLAEWIGLKGIDELRELFKAARSVALGITVLCVTVAVLALYVGRRRAFPVAVLTTAIGLAVWGQVALLEDRFGAGIGLYAAGFFCAVVFGILAPIRRLPGFAPGEAAAGGISAWTEALLVFGLFAVALLTRMWALNELPNGFDMETVTFMIASRTWDGFVGYLQDGMLANNNGIFHVLTKYVLYHLYGTSLFSERACAVLWGSAAVPLMYVLVRRIAGRGPALAAAVLILTAPEQLFWSRTENDFFAPVGVLAIVTGYLGIRMVERWSFGPVLAAALWTPFCRYFYTPSMVLFLYPVTLLAHSALFVRGAWRKLWWTVPVILGGFLLWGLSLSFVHRAVHGQWKFVHPAIVHAGPIWAKNGDPEFLHATPAQLVRLQAELITGNLREVVEGMAWHGTYMFSHWYERGHPFEHHRTISVVAFTVIVALAIGYLLGQLNDPRAFALLLWIVLGLLPGVMSNEPSPRRITVVFPALYATAAVFLGAVVRTMKQFGSDRLARLGMVFCVLAVAGVGGAGLVAHFTIGRAPVVFDDHIRFTRPLFEKSDIIFHNLDLSGLGRAILLGNLDPFVERGPCYEHIDAADWQSAVLDPQCRFRDDVYPNVFSAQHTTDLFERQRPKELAFLFEENAYTRSFLASVHTLYPRAAVRTETSPRDGKSLTSLTLPMSEVQALHRLVLHGAESSVVQILRGVASVRDSPSGAATSATGVQRGSDNGEISLVGGVHLGKAGWYRFDSQPHCDAAHIRIDGEAAAQVRPLLAGVHAFELRLSAQHDCALPLEIAASPVERMQDAGPLSPGAFLHPRVAAFAPFQAPKVRVDSGWSDPETVVEVHKLAKDFGIDASGRIAVFSGDFNPRQVQRFSAARQPEARWDVNTSKQAFLPTMLVEPDGTRIIISEVDVILQDADGTEITRWKPPWPEFLADGVVWDAGHLLMAAPDRNVLALFTRGGQLVAEWSGFEGGTYQRPVCIARDAADHLLVVQDNGEALILRKQSGSQPPQLVSRFPLDFSAVPQATHGCAIDSTGRVLITDYQSGRPLLYTLNGTRLLAGLPGEDLSRKGIGRSLRFLERDGHLYVLDHIGQRILAFTPTSTAAP